MSESQSRYIEDLDAQAAGVPIPVSPSRQTLLKRLADVVCLPESRINAFERAVTADLLVEMLSEAGIEDRARVARRLSHLTEVPNSLVRRLIVDDVHVARALIEECETLNDSDLSYCARNGSHAHRMMLAARKNLAPILSEILIEQQDVRVIEVILKNTRATLSQMAVEAVVVLSQSQPQLIPLVIKRSEMRPSSAYVMFWWADADVRRVILSRFAVNREVMQDAASDVFAMAADEGWQDALSRKALQFIERRQRNRAALARSPFDSLDAAIDEAARKGMTRHLAEEISYLAGIKPSTGAKILRDRGGEPLAVLCKATGLPKSSLRALWKALRRPAQMADGADHPELEHVLLTYDMLATDRAQTVLRYWNWSLSSALSATIIRALSKGEDVELEALSVPERAAMLAFAQDMKT
ncbi:DUF2336 domain-containing protein [Asticcacaulis machinosus]|uniref:DUF2336 domain-containing protein n=1 Tax=Asticcacaulis machinosus TaxID=2984211 RepID=A0ABT5HJ29_9CAUL|nr:DUF2336 domain-containing protein [Asticcacaulis machinosus]MDC7676212.1 DUF2336 domain-containing protein [Asticcacaulis machinosus]